MKTYLKTYCISDFSSLTYEDYFIVINQSATRETYKISYHVLREVLRYMITTGNLTDPFGARDFTRRKGSKTKIGKRVIDDGRK